MAINGKYISDKYKIFINCKKERGIFMNIKNIKIIAGLFIIIMIMAVIPACAEEGQFYSSSGRGFEFRFPSGWLFAEEPDRAIKVYKESEASIYIKDLTDDILSYYYMAKYGDAGNTLNDAAEYACGELLMYINDGKSIGDDIEYNFKEDASGQFVTGSADGILSMPFTLTITRIGERMIADVVSAGDKKSQDAADKARKTIMDSMKTFPAEIDREDAPWQGSYRNSDETKSLNITNFDGESFSFNLTSTDGVSFDGVATVDEYAAYYMDLIFAMSVKGNDVSIWIDEPIDGSYEREPFIDTYFRTEN